MRLHKTILIEIKLNVNTKTTRGGSSATIGAASLLQGNKSTSRRRRVIDPKRYPQRQGVRDTKRAIIIIIFGWCVGEGIGEFCMRYALSQMAIVRWARNCFGLYIDVSIETMP